MKRIIKLIRAKRISDFAKSEYDAAIFSCANVSRINNSLSFVICKIGAFGFPSVEPIQRPAVLSIAENNHCVVIKDGNIFELKTWL